MIVAVNHATKYEKYAFAWNVISFSFCFIKETGLLFVCIWHTATVDHSATWRNIQTQLLNSNMMRIQKFRWVFIYRWLKNIKTTGDMPTRTNVKSKSDIISRSSALKLSLNISDERSPSATAIERHCKFITFDVIRRHF